MLILSDILHDMHWIVVIVGCLLCIAAALGSRKQNVVLLVLYLAFVQLGAILYRLWPRGYVVLIPSLLSLAIEVMQLVLRTGLFELDDIVSNSLGGLIGVLVCWGIRKGMAAYGMIAAMLLKILHGTGAIIANVNRRGDFSDRNAIKPVNAEIQLKDFDGRTRNQLDNAISRLYARIYMNGQPYSKWNDMQALIKFVKANVYSEVIDYDVADLMPCPRTAQTSCPLTDSEAVLLKAVNTGAFAPANYR